MMPAATQRAYGGPDRPTFPDVVDAIGEDPARYLSDETSIDPWPRLSGIWDYPTATAFRAVARKLGADDDVQAYLEELVAALDEGDCPWVGDAR